MDGLQLMANFYISYASIRIVVIFATNVFNIALESIKDFPDLAKVLQKNRLETLRLAPNIFIPSLILELAIMSADRVCSYGERENKHSENPYSMILPTLANEFCHHTGLYFFTSKFPEIRRFIFVAIMVMVIQIWQISMNHFPNWHKTLNKLHFMKKFLFQTTVLVLVVLTIAATLFSWIKLHDFVSIEILCGVLLGWTVWIYSFAAVLVEINGRDWAENENLERDIIDSAVVVRISHMLILAIMFFGLFFFHGFPRAQLDMTIATIVIPTLYCAVYTFCSLSLRAGSTLVKIAFPVALLGSLFITVFLAKQYAKGSVILVFCHLFGKLVQYFGNDDHDDDDYDLLRKSSIDAEDIGDFCKSSSSDKEQDAILLANGNDDDGYGNYVDHEDSRDDLKQKRDQLIEMYGINNNITNGRYVRGSNSNNVTIEGRVSPIRSPNCLLYTSDAADE